MSDKRFKLIKPLGTRLGLKDIFIKDNQEDYYYNTKEDVVDLLNRLSEENEHLRQMIKENVFQRYRKGSLADLEFKAIAYDDIVKVEMSNELEPRVIVYCKQGKKENIMSYCQMIIPFGIAYEIKEVNDEG